MMWPFSSPLVDCLALRSTQPASPPKRRFRVRQDGWVRHDGGECPLPPKSRCMVLYRGVDILMEEKASGIPDQWWRQEDGKYDVLWFRPLENWREAEPAAWQ